MFQNINSRSAGIAAVSVTVTGSFGFIFRVISLGSWRVACVLWRALSYFSGESPLSALTVLTRKRQEVSLRCCSHGSVTVQMAEARAAGVAVYPRQGVIWVRVH